MIESYTISRRCKNNNAEKRTFFCFRAVGWTCRRICIVIATILVLAFLYGIIPITIYTISAYYTTKIYDPTNPKLDLVNPFLSMIHTIKDGTQQEDIIINSNIEDGSVRPNRTLVLMWGNLRGGERAWESFYKNVLDVNNADLALMVGDTDEFYMNATLFDRAKYHWKFNEYDDWADAITILNHNSTSWQDRLLPLVRFDSGILGGMKYSSYYGSGAIALVVRHFMYAAIKQYNLDQKYDRFIITRTDHYYTCEHDISELQPADNVYIPEGENYFGICDRHAVLSPNNVASVLDMLRPLIIYPEEYSIPLGYYPSGPEMILYRTMTKMYQIQPSMIKRFNRVMFTCGDADHQDMSRFVFRPSLNHLVKPEFVRYKYYGEYRASSKTCKKKKSNYWTSSFLFS